MERFVVISGCSGGGKSTLLGELARRGHHVMEEPGRRIVKAEMAAGGTALPWVNLEAFLRQAIEISLADRQSAARYNGWTFFDRGLVDAASGLSALTGEAALETLGMQYRYNERVFLTPPWPEIYRQDEERRHDSTAAVAEYERLVRDFARLGYEAVVLPKVSVAERADLVLGALGA